MKKISIAVLIVLFIIICIIGTDFYLLWLPLAHSPEYPTKVTALFMAVTALVTLFLALATFNATKQSNLREQERRKDEIEKEKRDRKERLLNEIIEWAIDIHHCTNPILRPGENEVLIRYNILTNLINMAATDEYIRKVSKIEFSDPLIKEVDELTNKAFLYGCVLKLSLDSKPELSEEWRKAFIESVAKEKLDAIDKVIKQDQGPEAWSKIIDEYQVLVRGLAQKVTSSCAEIKTKLIR